MRTLGSGGPFFEQPWDETYEFLRGMADEHPKFEHMVAVAESVIRTESTELLAGTLSMHDILVLPRPLTGPPYEVIAVRSPSSLRKPAPGTVRIEHLSLSGRDEVIDRPVADAVRLFWRFVWEKFGVRPASGVPGGGD
ncbi:hypothetical protein [Kribbella sp. NPDC048928]|uniref:hypothetical protein n=1 Tax=Kribbella sp. NPDC048928 TaxID=3364111 RepID=UPI0037136062